MVCLPSYFDLFQDSTTCGGVITITEELAPSPDITTGGIEFESTVYILLCILALGHHIFGYLYIQGKGITFITCILLFCPIDDICWHLNSTSAVLTIGTKLSLCDN